MCIAFIYSFYCCNENVIVLIFVGEFCGYYLALNPDVVATPIRLGKGMYVPNPYTSASFTKPMYIEFRFLHNH